MNLTSANSAPLREKIRQINAEDSSRRGAEHAEENNKIRPMDFGKPASPIRNNAMTNNSISANSAPLPETNSGRSFFAPRRENEITGIIIDVAIDIHRRLGPGLLESVYSAVLAHELRKRGLHVDVERPIPVEWDDVFLDVGFRADLIVENLAVVELKSIESVAPVHKKILLTYLRLSDKRVGLLINFGMELLKDGIHRVVNNFEESHAEAQSSQRTTNQNSSSAHSAPLRDT